MAKYASSLYLRLRTIATKVSYPLFTKMGGFRRKLMDEEDTMLYIIKNNCSISRFGDGEFGIMRNQAIGFQQVNEELAKRLLEVAENPIADHLVCLPYALKSITGLKSDAKQFWIGEIGTKYLLWSHVFRKHKQFGSTQISRFYIDYVTDYQAKKLIPLWRKLWNNKKLLIIEGCNTRLGVGNDLFDNATSISRIICPGQDAFSKYDIILQTTQNEYYKMGGGNVLILIALGPTATVLAYDLAKIKIQSIDIGHIDLEYEWYKMRAESKVNIPSKAVNEVVGGLSTIPVDDAAYSKSIIAEIK